MKNFSKSSYLVINSEEKPILFQLGSQGDVKYTFLNKNYEPIETLELYKDNVSKYSVDIDENDKIQLVALMKSGELNYSIWEGGNWSNTIIAKFDFRSKIYNNLDILAEESNTHIIYDYANLINLKLSTIQHVVGTNHNWQQQNVVKLVLDKRLKPYAFDNDSFGTIHLLYSSLEGNVPQICHTFYNPYANKWNPTPQNLTSSNTNKLYPYIFADTEDNLHGLWLEEMDNNHVLKYSRLNSSGNQKYIWNQIKIPYISRCNNMPIIFEEKDILKIIYIRDNSIGYIYSLDRGNTWFEGDDLHIDSSYINFIKVSNPIIKSKSAKINNIYCSIDKELNFYFSDSFNSLKVNDSSDIIDEPNLVIGEKKEMEKINIEIAQFLQVQEEIKNTLNKALDSQNRIEEKIKYILEILETKQGSFLNRFFK